jgi:hypothetical protein
MTAAKYMSVREVANTTGLAETMIRTKIKQNAVPGFYSGRKFVIDVPAFLASLGDGGDSNPVTSPTTGKPIPKGSPKKDEPSLRDILKTEIRNVVREELRIIVREELRSILIEGLK